jgi:hypothetical protein
MLMTAWCQFVSLTNDLRQWMVSCANEVNDIFECIFVRQVFDFWVRMRRDARITRFSL